MKGAMTRIPLFLLLFFFSKADGALYSKPLNHTFSPEFKESQRGGERSGRERGGGGRNTELGVKNGSISCR